MVTAAGSPPDPTLVADFRAGKRFALARAISLVENERPGFEALLHTLHPEVGRAHRVGLTGPPGAGKSTLTSALASAYRSQGQRVGVVAVDPSSPFTGGALLGDRIRMGEIATDPGVFIRSMAARGALGGLALGSREVADLLDAFGFGRIITETVGVGQSELEIAGAADTTVVVLVPESGDSIQAMKAGLMEVADVFVINKADRPGADRLARELELMLHLRSGDGRGAAAGSRHHRAPAAVGSAARRAGRERVEEDGGWAIPVLTTVAQEGTGVDELVETLERHRGYLEDSGELMRRRSARLADRVRRLVDREMRRRIWKTGPGEEILDAAAADLASGASPYGLASRIVASAFPAETLPEP